ncbi:MAG: T9SS type A sorting domain-containing protein [Candidatus Kapabacteria bacterium]|nr:T9SS type A sorting domain-containing protein [Candidatus Kapabacteria bacterium]
MKKYFVLIAALLFVLISASKADLPDTVWCKYTYPTQINAVKFTPDGKWLASAGTDGVVRLWETQTGNLVREYLGAGSAIWGMDIDMNDSLIAAVTDLSKITIWNINTAKVEKIIDIYPNQTNPLQYNSLSFSKSGKYLAAHIAKYNPNKSEPAIFLWSTKDWSVLGKVENIWSIFHVVFSPDETLLSATNYVNTDKTESVALYQVPTLKLVKILPSTGVNGIFQSVFSNDGTNLGAACSSNGDKIWNTSDWSLFRNLNQGSDSRAIAFSPDNKYLVAGFTIGGKDWDRLFICDLSTGTTKYSYLLNWFSYKFGEVAGDTPLSISISQDQKYIAVSGGVGIYLLNAKWHSLSVSDNPIQITNPIIFPNPTNGTANIQFSLLKPEQTQIQIYDSASNLISLIFNGLLQQGIQNFPWNASSVASGVYFARISAAGQTSTIQIIINK